MLWAGRIVNSCWDPAVVAYIVLGSATVSERCCMHGMALGTRYFFFCTQYLLTGKFSY